MLGMYVLSHFFLRKLQSSVSVLFRIAMMIFFLIHCNGSDFTFTPLLFFRCRVLFGMNSLARCLGIFLSLFDLFELLLQFFVCDYRCKFCDTFFEAEFSFDAQ